jgi:alpha-glucosidase
MLTLYRAALHIRRAEPGLGDGPIAWLAADPGVLAFRRGEGFICLVNLTGSPAELPGHEEILLTSGPLTDGLLPTDTAIWLRA